MSQLDRCYKLVITDSRLPEGYNTVMVAYCHITCPPEQAAALLKQYAARKSGISQGLHICLTPTREPSASAATRLSVTSEGIGEWLPPSKEKPHAAVLARPG